MRRFYCGRLGKRDMLGKIAFSLVLVSFAMNLGKGTLVRERNCIMAGREGDCEDTQKIDFSWTAVGEFLTL